MDEELDRKLRAFLEDTAKDRRDGHTLERVQTSLDALRNAFLQHQQEDQDQFRSLRTRTESLEAKQDRDHERIEAIKDKLSEMGENLRDTSRQVEEVTGSHQIPPQTTVVVKERKSLFPDEAKRWIVWAAFVAGGGGLGALIHALASGH